MRTIDADALVAQWEVDAEQTEDFTAKMFIYGAIRDVKHAPTVEPEPHWIPVSERLPEKDGYYLVSEDDGGIEVEWYDNTGWGYCGVIAWMPTLSPYKEDGNEGR